MQINKISYNQPKQTTFKAVNQRYFQRALKEYKQLGNISYDWVQMMSIEVFLYKRIAKQDAIDTVEVVKKFMKESDAAIDDLLKRYKDALGGKSAKNSVNSSTSNRS